MKIYQPKALNELGGRENNEDSVFPVKGKATVDDRLFLVCDGVGGHAKGEIASSLTCKYFYEYFQISSKSLGESNFIELGLKYVERKLQEYQSLYKESQGMGTTLTLVYLSENPQNALVAWVGDSRVYHIRDGEILFRTKDHSEVQDLINMGEITEEEAKSHPRKNVILRAVSGTSKPTRIDQVVLSDIRKDDWFFLCTDGVLEQLDEKLINQWFVDSQHPEEIHKKVFDRCEGKTKDNFSAYILKIKESAFIPIDSSITKTIGMQKQIFFQSKVSTELEAIKKGNNRRFLFWALVVLILITLSYLGYGILSKPTSSIENSSPKVEDSNSSTNDKNQIEKQSNLLESEENMQNENFENNLNSQNSYEEQIENTNSQEPLDINISIPGDSNQIRKLIIRGDKDSNSFELELKINVFNDIRKMISSWRSQIFETEKNTFFEDIDNLIIDSAVVYGRINVDTLEIAILKNGKLLNKGKINDQLK